jgi:hypothetical protein
VRSRIDRRAVVVVAAGVLLLAGCSSGGESSPVPSTDASGGPSTDTLLSALVTPDDLEGEWEVLGSPGVIAEDSPYAPGVLPVVCGEAGADSAAEPAWQVEVTLLAAQPGPDQGQPAQLVEYLAAVDPAEIGTTFAAVRDEMARCFGEQTDPGTGYVVRVVQQGGVPAVGDEQTGVLVQGAGFDPVGGDASTFVTHLALVRTGAVLIAVGLLEQGYVADYTGDISVTLTDDEFAALVTAAVAKV